MWLHWCWMEGQDYLSHNLRATLPFMQPRIPLAFFATRAQCWPVFQRGHGEVMLQTGSFQIGCFQRYVSMGKSNLSTNFLWYFSLHFFFKPMQQPYWPAEVLNGLHPLFLKSLESGLMTASWEFTSAAMKVAIWRHWKLPLCSQRWISALWRVRFKPK